MLNIISNIMIIQHKNVACYLSLQSIAPLQAENVTQFLSEPASGALLTLETRLWESQRAEVL